MILRVLAVLAMSFIFCNISFAVDISCKNNSSATITAGGKYRYTTNGVLGSWANISNYSVSSGATVGIAGLGVQSTQALEFQPYINGGAYGSILNFTPASPTIYSVIYQAAPLPDEEIPLDLTGLPEGAKIKAGYYRDGERIGEVVLGSGSVGSLSVPDDFAGLLELKVEDISVDLGDGVPLDIPDLDGQLLASVSAETGLPEQVAVDIAEKLPTLPKPVEQMKLPDGSTLKEMQIGGDTYYYHTSPDGQTKVVKTGSGFAQTLTKGAGIALDLVVDNTPILKEIFGTTQNIKEAVSTGDFSDNDSLDYDGEGGEQVLKDSSDFFNYTMDQSSSAYDRFTTERNKFISNLANPLPSTIGKQDAKVDFHYFELNLRVPEYIRNLFRFAIAIAFFFGFHAVVKYALS